MKIKLGSKPISQVEQVKYLGILVDSTLSWKPHVTELSKKHARTCGIFCKLRQYVSPEILNVLYYSLFFSIVSYHISIWGLTHPSTLDILFKLQKTAIRIMTLSMIDILIQTLCFPNLKYLNYRIFFHFNSYPLYINVNMILQFLTLKI